MSERRKIEMEIIKNFSREEREGSEGCEAFCFHSSSFVGFVTFAFFARNVKSTIRNPQSAI